MCPHDHRVKLFILTIHLFIKLFSMEILVLRILIVCLLGPVHTTYFEILNISKIQEKVPTRTAGLSILLNIALYNMGTTETWNNIPSTYSVFSTYIYITLFISFTVM